MLCQRTKALEKVLAVKKLIGYPPEITDMAKLNEYYKGLWQDDRDELLDNYLKVQSWLKKKEFLSLREPVVKPDWRESAYFVPTANAFYMPTDNNMLFPAGILQPPFFDAQLPLFVNYATIGMVMGHELTHGFDSEGSQFDVNGDLKEWFSEESRNRLTDKAQCYIDQYNQFVDSTTNLNINGSRTKEENMADSGAIKLAYNAYQRLNLDEPLLPNLTNYTREQQFMLSTASIWCARYTPDSLKEQINSNDHSPTEFRVNGMFQNFDAFSSIFQCLNDDPMNPPKRCSLWD